MTRSLMRVAIVVMCAFIPLSAQALTFKKGQVLGNDGQLYEGASPEEMDRLVAKAKDEAKQQVCSEAACLLSLAKV